MVNAQCQEKGPSLDPPVARVGNVTWSWDWEPQSGSGSAAHPLLFSPQGAKYRGSIHDFPNFDPGQDAEALYNAMKGFGG